MIAALVAAVTLATLAPVVWPADVPEGTVAVVDCEDVVAAGEAAYRLAPVELPDGWTFEVGCGADGWTGWYDIDARTVTVWPEAVPSPERLRWVIVHEVGHAWEVEQLTDAGRVVWMAARGLSAPWRPAQTSYGDWFNPAEDFAEVFTACRLPDGHLTLEAETPTGRDCQLQAALLRR